MGGDPAELSNSFVDLPDPQILEAEILDGAAGPRDEVRCIVPAESKIHATDPMPWPSHTEPDGLYYPKRGDRALVAVPIEGPPAIVAWWPGATSPDHAF